jgi:exodeoxyribonuclease VII small subunit
MSKANKSLRQLLDEFEAIVDWFAGQELDVEQATAKFEQGARLAELIKKQLAEAKNQIEIVKQKFDVQ